MPTPDLSRAALSFIEKMQHKHAKQVLLKIIGLCQNPEPPDSMALRGSPEGYRRADCGEYRVIYRVVDDVVKIDLVGKRNDDEVYRQLKRRS